MSTEPSRSCRKRSRSGTDECDECLPISKRINNLSIRHSIESWRQGDGEHPPGTFNNNQPCCTNSAQGFSADGSHMTVQGTPGNPAYGWTPPSPQDSPPPMAAPHQIQGLQGSPRMHSLLSENQAINGSTPGMNHQNGLHGNPDCCTMYQPELTSSENPHYFGVNGMLYEAHMSRVNRGAPPNLPL